jgi:hypothetical protein
VGVALALLLGLALVVFLLYQAVRLSWAFLRRKKR